MEFGKCLLTVIEVSPRIMGLYNQIFIVKHSKPINYVSTEVCVDIFRNVFSNSSSVPSPVGEVADDLEVPGQWFVGY